MPNDQTAQTDATQTPPEEIAYTPTVWQDGEDGGTPINAANMNNIEEAIVALVERTTKQVVTSMIADGAVTNAKLDQTLRDSLSRMRLSMCSAIRFAVTESGAYIQFVDNDDKAIFGISASNLGGVSGINYRE